MIIEAIIGWISLILVSEQLSKAEAKDKSAIIEGLKTAILQTQRHIDLTRNKETNSDADSTELMMAWAKVAKLIRPYDPTLARLFDDKSYYWNNPKQFFKEVT